MGKHMCTAFSPSKIKVFVHISVWRPPGSHTSSPQALESHSTPSARVESGDHPAGALSTFYKCL